MNSKSAVYARILRIVIFFFSVFQCGGDVRAERVKLDAQFGRHNPRIREEFLYCTLNVL